MAINTQWLRYRLESVARALVGRVVRVWFAQPATQGAIAESILGSDGVPVVKLAPALLGNEPELLWNFLHECAHVKLHAKDWTPGTWDKVRPGGLDTAVWRKTAVYRQREHEADKLAGEWLSYAQQHACSEHTKSASPPGLERALDALLVPADLREMARATATKAATDYMRRAK